MKQALDFATVRQLHQEGNLKEAKQGYLTLLKKDPRDSNTLHALAILSTQEDHLKDAETYLMKAIEIQPNNLVFHLHLANVYKLQGLYSQSVELLQHIIKEDPSCISAYNNLGSVLFSQGKISEAIDAYRQAIQIQPDYIDAHYNLGLALIKHNELDAAIALYEELLKNSPQHVAARFHLACALMQREQLSRAEKHFLIIDESHPYHFETQTNLATCYLKLGALNEAKKHYLNALQLSQRDTQVLFNLGVIQTQLGNLDSAIQHYQRALQIDPDYFEAHNNLGGIFILKQHANLALHHFREALRLQPSNTAIQYTVNALSKNQLLLASPPDYITSLFDAYADHYDAHLLKALDYQVPGLLYSAIASVTKLPTMRWDILDLGCGTGLCGEVFKTTAHTLVGIDLSSKMLAIAKQKQIYTELISTDIFTYLLDITTQFDLIIAGDVFVYIGDLEKIFSMIKTALREKALFAFNTEISETEDFRMNQSGRFIHSKKYIDELAQKLGFQILFYQTPITRLQNNEPVYGHLYVLQS